MHILWSLAARICSRCEDTSEACVSLTTLKSSTQPRTAAHPRPTYAWQKPITALLVVDAKLFHHGLLLAADLCLHADGKAHGATTAMADDEPALPM